MAAVEKDGNLYNLTGLTADDLGAIFRSLGVDLADLEPDDDDVPLIEDLRGAIEVWVNARGV